MLKEDHGFNKKVEIKTDLEGYQKTKNSI